LNKKLFTALLIIVAIICLQSFVPKQTIKKDTIESLGKLLFFEKKLSGDKTMSCASCHIPAFAFADTVALSRGINGKKAIRNTPSVMNVASREALFWDGRAKTLQEQVLFPIQNPNEMNCPIAVVVQRLNEDKKYRKMFHTIFKSNANEKNIGDAIAAFENTLETSNTANDRWINELPNGLTNQQLRGREIYFGKGKCIECHYTPDFTGDEFKNIGLFDGKKWTDSGRYLITKNTTDIGKFKVPGLRNCSITAPYMHDGSFATLHDVIDFYNTPNKYIAAETLRDPLLLDSLHLTTTEMTDLESFLNGMTDKQFLK
jgi:cytochrome c peroxidase